MFYFRLSPHQPRATLKTKMDGGLFGPPFIEARISADSKRGAPVPQTGLIHQRTARLSVPPSVDTGNSSFDGDRLIDHKPAMAKKPGTNPKGEFAFFNVFYEDGSQRSNRRVPSELVGGLDGDEPARGFIMEQDREIAEKSGRPPLAIKSLDRVGAKKK